MNILSIEVSCGRASVAIYSNKTICAFFQDREINMQAENLFPLIDKIFAVTNFRYNDINYLTVTSGPGSFTGIRIGLSAVRGIMLAAPHLMPVVLNNFEVMAFRALKQVSSDLKHVVVMFEASTTTVYVQSFDSDLNPYHEPQILVISDINDYLQEYQGLLALAGNCIKSIMNSVDRAEDLIVLPRFHEIDAKLLVSLAAYKIRLNKPISRNIEPLYIKPPSAIFYSQ
jgi:tRNA threonylcarbamoyladenosine biosynthesis protein TsaB